MLPAPERESCDPTHQPHPKIIDTCQAPFEKHINKSALACSTYELTDSKAPTKVAKESW